MSSALIKFFNFLENPEYPCLGPHIWVFTLTGQWHPEPKTLKARIKMVLYYITMIFYCSQYIRCIQSYSESSMQLILKFAPFHLGIAKTSFFQKDYKEWVRLMTYISEVEVKGRSSGDEKTEEIMNQYIKRSRIVTYLFWGMAIISNIGIFTEPFRNNQIGENGTNVYPVLFDGYTPFEREPPGYYFSIAIQTFLGNLMSAYVISWDMMIVSIMMFFVGQLKISRLHCIKAIDVQNKLRSQKNIAECHRYHTRLVRYQKRFNYLISRVMFVYLIVVSVNLGMCIIQIAEMEDDVHTLAASCFYLGAILIQLLLYYWHSNEVTVESENVSYGVFESEWTDADKSIQKEIALLCLTTSTRLVFSAGPFNEMSLTTFIAILRRSYSFFTLLKGTN